MDSRVIAVVGGTGKLGAALARRLAKTGRSVIIGSRSAESAQQMAAALGFGLRGMGNADAAREASIVFVTVPFAGQEATLAEIRPHVGGKIVVDTTVPLVPPKVMRVQLPPEGSAALRTQHLLGVGVTVVSGFHNVAAHKLATDENVACDVLVFGDDKQARAAVVELAGQAGLRGIHGGPLVNSAAAEAMTSLLIFINKTYRSDGAGIQITGELIEPDA
ncbi:NADPH-dependent F420 reductase [Sphingobium phenoxybenzoativorans]|jgi:NADPH-dependent F420 reductase|uniref:NADPH-dependent F420 reductase n=1 Tax=Sphingobium phenoxybenzoativorans TaxID=1592790 RepID=A0A975K9D0_9SPHN|nr:NADPH-dependent F420 reductase [Sphingobium phenoxybenzoativorans]QUT07175.1 NADPH-dependent F420 reductase [Sphingobium phenoxybenzoativorans]